MTKRRNHIPLSHRLRLPLLLISLLLIAATVYASDFVKTTAALSVDKLAAGEHFKIALLVEVKPGMHINAANEMLGLPPTIELDGGTGLTFGKAVFPQPIRKKFPFSDKPIPVYEGKFKVIAPGQIANNAKQGPRNLTVSLRYQICDDNTCYPPNTALAKITTSVAPTGSAKPANEAIFTETKEDGATSEAGFTDKLLATLRDSNPIVAALISFLLGLTLCLTPCVYPMIPVTVGFFAGQAQGRRSRSITLALMYVIGMALTYSVLGVLAASFGMMTGAILQSPLIIGIIALIFTALALSMFGLYELNPPAFIMNRSGGKSGLIGALLMGLMLGLVASPCIGPVVGGVAVWVTKLQNPILGFWIFFSLALGLGLPFLALATFAGAIDRLPQAGEWMVTVKKLSGLVLLGVAAYFARLLLPIDLQRFVIPVFLIITGIVLSLKKSFIFGKATFVRPALGIVVALLGLWSLQTPSKGIVWETYTPDSLRLATQHKKPVMIDFTAAWCVACKELEEKAFTNPDVIAKSKNFARFRADLTWSSEATDALVRKYGVKGLPTVIFIDSNGHELKKARVIGFLPPDEFLDRMNSVDAEGN